MFLYVGKTYTASTTGSQRKTVTCEKCAQEFHYELTRIGTGRGTAPYYLGQNSAQHRAQHAARQNLAKRLNRDAELVPCPACKWVNRAAIAQYRKSKYRAWIWIAAVIFFLGAFIDFILLVQFDSIFHRTTDIFAPEIIRVALVTLVLTSLPFLLRWTLCRRINPNRLLNGQPQIPPGTPPALVKQPNPASGLDTLLVVPSESSNLQTEAQWATFRPGQLAPLLRQPICCQCLDPATDSYKLPMMKFLERQLLPVPVCQPCLKKLRTQWWLQNLGVLPAAFVVGWVLSLIPQGIDANGRNFETYLFAGVAAIAGFLLVDRHLRPYRLRTVDQERSISKIRFKNPAYTALLIRKIGEADGLYPSPNDHPPQV